MLRPPRRVTRNALKIARLPLLARARSSLGRHEPLWWHGWALLVVLAAAAAFYLPALRRTGGPWPAPLDDVYIYFGFARSLALGHGLSWFPGNGYSSGCTSVIYPLLLAPGWALGLRGSSLGLFAALLAVGLLVDLCRSLRSVQGGHASSWLVPPLVVSIPLLDWSWFSGMETALLGAVLGRALRAAHRCLVSPPEWRAARQLRLGIWLGVMLLTRPETVALAVPLAIAVVHGARALGTFASLGRTLGPLAATGLGQATVNRVLTGEWAAAGAVRKLIWSVPYTDAMTGLLEVLKNLVVIEHQAFERALGPAPWNLALLTLALLGALLARHRRLGVALLVGLAGTTGLVCLNATARYQNLRYAAPALGMLLASAALGLHALAAGRPHGPGDSGRRRDGRSARLLLAGALGLAAVLGASTQLRAQSEHFARASANILEQQGEVARRLRERAPQPHRVLVNDAGAMPYLSELAPLDGLGLGGFRGLPFARASAHGVPAVVELIERMAPAERPDVLALYPQWWGGLADVFGRRVDAVRIRDNVICAADEKVIYLADWSLLEPPGTTRPGELDRLDVADLVDERAHDHELPAPGAGWVVGATHELPHAPGEPAVARWDAGRIVPRDRIEAFRVRAEVAAGPATLVLRTDVSRPWRLHVEVAQGRAARSILEQPVAPCDEDAWTEIEVPLAGVAGGERIELSSPDSEWRSFNLWLVRP